MLRAALRSASNAAKRAASSAAAGNAALFLGRQASSWTAAAAPKTESAGVFAFGVAAFAATTGIAFASSPKERSFIMVKPDGVNRGLVGDVIARFEKKGYKLVGCKLTQPSREIASLHYAEHDGKPFFPSLVDFLSGSGPVVALVFEGKGVVAYGRVMIGATNPLASAPGTIRGDHCIEVSRNAVHGSDSVESAQREIALWFKPEELANYAKLMDGWVYEK